MVGVHALVYVAEVIKISARIGQTPVVARFDGDVAANPDAALPMFLLTAMMRGEPLILDEAVSASALASATEAQSVVSMWWPEIYRRVDIVAETSPDIRSGAQERTASFFSGGVDSFYTALTGGDEITQLVLVHGFDIALADRRLRDQAAAAAKDAAAELGKELLQVETDAPSVTQVNFDHVHGALLVAVGMLLEPRPGKVVIPASYTYRDLFPWGSHPVLDPLWTTDAQRVIHHAAGVSRFEKTGTIAASDVALRHLRVCNENRKKSNYNCGGCAKCLRTMITLRLHGRLEACHTLPNDLKLGALARYHPKSAGEIAFLSDTLAAARERGDDEVARALSRSLAPSRLRRSVDRVTVPLRWRVGAALRRFGVLPS